MFNIILENRVKKIGFRLHCVCNEWFLQSVRESGGKTINYKRQFSSPNRFLSVFIDYMHPDIFLFRIVIHLRYTARTVTRDHRLIEVQHGI